MKIEPKPERHPRYGTLGPASPVRHILKAAKPVPVDMTAIKIETEINIERVVEYCVTNVTVPKGKAIPIEDLRGMSKASLRAYRLPVPDDAWLDTFITEMAEWHHVALK